MAFAERALPRFDGGRVVTRTFSVIGNNIAKFGLLSLLIGLPSAIEIWRSARIPPVLTRGFFIGSADAVLFITQILAFVGYFVLQAAIVHSTIMHLNARSVNVAQSLSVGFRFSGQLILILLLMTLGLLLGFVLLLIPGFILLVIWSVVVPCCIAERTGVIGAFKRSRELTRGHRWAIFGVLLAFVILNAAIWVTVGSVTGMTIAAAIPMGTGGTLNPTPLQIAIYVIFSMIISVINATLVASIYYELRVLKDGIGPEALAAVFD